MLYSSVTPTDKRLTLRRRLAAPELLVLPGAFNALSARLIERAGFEGVYVSGHMVATSLGLPDLGMTTAPEVAAVGQSIARMTDLPTIIDGDTGFGEPLNLARTIQTFEDAGVAGCHLEDQVNPKRCGHTDGVEVVPVDVATRRVRAAVAARRDESFLIIARTDARNVEGIDAAVDRARAFADVGADVIFPDAVTSPEDVARFRAAVDLPLMVNLNEFGRGLPPTQQQMQDLGVSLAIYPMTLLRAAMGAAEQTLRAIRDDGGQHRLMPQMQTADELYDLIQLPEYTEFDGALLQAAGKES